MTYKFEPPPRSLFKYISLSNENRWTWLEDIVVRHRIFLSSPSDFNDPFDCAPTLSSPKTAIAWEVTSKRYIQRIEREFGANEARAVRAGLKKLSNRDKLRLLNEASRLSAEQTGIYCLTELSDNVLMWSHYADNHKGVCVEFRIDSHPISHIHAVARVFYQTERPELPILRIDDDENRTYDALRTKAEFWAYEKEWRLMLAGAARKSMDIPKNVVASIILGARCTQETAARVEQIAAQSSSSLIIRKAEISSTAFKLEVS